MTFRADGQQTWWSSFRLPAGTGPRHWAIHLFTSAVGMAGQGYTMMTRVETNFYGQPFPPFNVERIELICPKMPALLHRCALRVESLNVSCDIGPCDGSLSIPGGIELRDSFSFALQFNDDDTRLETDVDIRIILYGRTPGDPLEELARLHDT